MDAQSGKIARRKRKTPPRRVVPAVVEQREQKPFIFGWGADLNNRERDSIKEKIALIGGIAIAAVVAAIIGWGIIQDSIIKPANERAANDKPIATIGNYTIRAGLFKRFETFRNTQFNNQVQQLQSQLSPLQAQPKKNAQQISQLQQEIGYLQQTLQNLPSNALETLITNETVIQRASAAGVHLTPQQAQAQVTLVEHQVGGKRHFQQFLQQSNLSLDELKMLVIGSYLQQKVTQKVQTKVATTALKVRASHILIATKLHSLAVVLYHRVQKNPKLLPSLAKKYSIDPGSGKRGGDLGFFAKGQMVLPFEQAAFSMKVGQIRLVQSKFGWHIIEVTARKKAALTPQEMSAARSGAFQNWLSQQKAILHIQRYVSTASLPNVVTPTPNTLGNGLPNTTTNGGLPSQLPSGTRSNQLPSVARPGQVQVTKPRAVQVPKAPSSKAPSSGSKP